MSACPLCSGTDYASMCAQGQCYWEETQARQEQEARWQAEMQAQYEAEMQERWESEQSSTPCPSPQ